MTPLDHIADGTSKVITQYLNKPVFLKYLAVYLNQIQYVENALVAIFQAFQLDTATGFRLDWIGRKVGQSRVGSNEEVFRRFIRGRIAANRSRGSMTDVIKVARAVLDNYRYEQLTCTVYVFTTDTLNAELADAVQGLLTQAVGPGIQVYLVVEDALPVFLLTQVGQEAESMFALTDDATGLPVSAPAYLARVSS